MNRAQVGSRRATGLLRHDRTVGRVRFVVSGGVDLAGASPGAVDARAGVAQELGVAPDHLLLPRQVHGDRVVEVAGPWPGDVPEADGLLVRTPGTAVGVLAADCMPLLLGDPAAGLAAAVHVGRRGLQAGIAEVAVRLLADAGARSLLAVLGPTVCGRCYEVPEQMRAEVAEAVPAAASCTRHGTPAVDISAGVGAQLRAAAGRCGLAVEVDASWSGCTMEDPVAFSHRRDAPTGRHGGFVVVGPAPSGSS